MRCNASFHPKIVAFCCENSGCLAAEMAAELKLAVPQRMEILNLPCGGKLDAVYILQALEKGADGVIVFLCQIENCKFLRGNFRAAQRVGQAQGLLKEIGIEPERVAIGYLAANMGHKFTELVQDFYARLSVLGPNPGKVIRK